METTTLTPVKEKTIVKHIFSPEEKKLINLLANIIVDKTLNDARQLHEKSN